MNFEFRPVWGCDNSWVLDWKSLSTEPPVGLCVSVPGLWLSNVKSTSVCLHKFPRHLSSIALVDVAIRSCFTPFRFDDKEFLEKEPPLDDNDELERRLNFEPLFLINADLPKAREKKTNESNVANILFIVFMKCPVSKWKCVFMFPFFFFFCVPVCCAVAEYH